MSMFSPAERSMAMMLPSSSDRISESFIHRRSSCTSTSIGTFAILATSSCGVTVLFPRALSLQVYGFLHDVVFGRDHLRVRLITAFVREQVRKLLRDIYRGSLKRATGDIA